MRNYTHLDIQKVLRVSHAERWRESLPELTLVSARELGQAEPEGRGNLISKDCEACPELV